MLKISYAVCLRLYLAISAQFTLKMRVAAQNRKKLIETPYFVGSRSFKVMNVDIAKKLVSIACYDKQHRPICAYLQLFLFFTLDEPITVK